MSDATLREKNVFLGLPGLIAGSYKSSEGRSFNERSVVEGRVTDDFFDRGMKEWHGVVAFP